MSAPSELERALREAQGLGMLGERPIPEVIAHSRVYLEGLHDLSGRIVDLGSGGGVPGLVIAVERPDLEVDLVERRGQRADFLHRMVARLHLTDRVRVRPLDARALARQEAGAFIAVTARGFGPPEHTLRLAHRLVAPSGRILISDPPEGERWPAELLDGLELLRTPLIHPSGRLSMFHVKHADPDGGSLLGDHGRDKSVGDT